MKRVLKKIVFAILLLPIVLILISLFLPSHYQVERSTLINAKPGEIFPLLHELRRWPEWTAWTTNREPSLVYSHTGPAAGVGAIQSWTANSGRGLIKLTASDPTNGIAYDLNFNEGRFVATGKILMQAADNGTQVTWTTEGELGANPVGRYLGLLMDKMMGNDFAVGLANLKARFDPPLTAKPASATASTNPGALAPGASPAR